MAATPRNGDDQLLQPPLVGIVKSRRGVGGEVRGSADGRIRWIGIEEVAGVGHLARRFE
ncbi:MAG TPA: hypothetical protein VM818_13070 [Vicinamibacterales bacterium]|nr:hypothetical protein [Vicinamibacterales bacterium]